MCVHSVCVCMYVCMCVCVYVYVCAYIYVCVCVCLGMGGRVGKLVIGQVPVGGFVFPMLFVTNP